MNEFVRNLRIMWFAMIIWPLMLLAIAYFIKEPGTRYVEIEGVNIFRYVVPLVGVIAIVTGFIVYKRKLISVAKISGTRTRLDGYRGVMIQRIATVEGSALFSAVAYMITSDPLLLVYTLIFMLFYLPIFPVGEKISRVLDVPLNE